MRFIRCLKVAVASFLGLVSTDPDCWLGGYTEKECCSVYFGPKGNTACWDGHYTFARCCQKTTTTTTSMDPWKRTWSAGYRRSDLSLVRSFPFCDVGSRVQYYDSNGITQHGHVTGKIESDLLISTDIVEAGPVRIPVTSARGFPASRWMTGPPCSKDMSCEIALLTCPSIKLLQEASGQVVVNMDKEVLLHLPHGSALRCSDVGGRMFASEVTVAESSSIGKLSFCLPAQCEIEVRAGNEGLSNIAIDILGLRSIASISGRSVKLGRIFTVVPSIAEQWSEFISWQSSRLGFIVAKVWLSILAVASISGVSYLEPLSVRAAVNELFAEPRAPDRPGSSILRIMLGCAVTFTHLSYHVKHTHDIFHQPHWVNPAFAALSVALTASASAKSLSADVFRCFRQYMRVIIVKVVSIFIAEEVLAAWSSSRIKTSNAGWSLSRVFSLDLCSFIVLYGFILTITFKILEIASLRLFGLVMPHLAPALLLIGYISSFHPTEMDQVANGASKFSLELMAMPIAYIVTKSTPDLHPLIGSVGFAFLIPMTAVNYWKVGSVCHADYFSGEWIEPDIAWPGWLQRCWAHIPSALVGIGCSLITRIRPSSVSKWSCFHAMAILSRVWLFVLVTGQGQIPYYIQSILENDALYLGTYVELCRHTLFILVVDITVAAFLYVIVLHPASSIVERVLRAVRSGQK